MTASLDFRSPQDPTHHTKKISRLDGGGGGIGTRIPLPSSFGAGSNANRPPKATNAQQQQPTQTAASGSNRTTATATAGVGKQHNGVLGLKQQATTLLPKNLTTEKLCQVANLVRTKTTTTLKQRFNFRPAATVTNKHPTMVINHQHKNVDLNMPMEVMSSPGDERSAALPTMSATMTFAADATTDGAEDVAGTTLQQTPVALDRSLIRSQTFDLQPGNTMNDAGVASTVADLAATTQTIDSPTLQGTFIMQTSSPNLNATQTLKRFSLGESLIMDTSAAVLAISPLIDAQSPTEATVAGAVIQTPHSDAGHVSGLLRARMKQSVQQRLDGTFTASTKADQSPHLNTTQTLERFSVGESAIMDTSASVLVTPPSFDTQSSDASHVTGLLRAKMKQSVQQRFDGTFTATTNGDQSMDGPPLMGNCSQIGAARDTTITVNARPRNLDSTTTIPNPWNVTETLTSQQSQQQSDTLESENTTLMAMSVEHERMEYDDGTNGEF